MKTLDTDAADTHTPFKKFSQGYTFKVLMLIALVLLLLIPLSMVRSIVNERSFTASSAEAEIMEAWGKELLEAGPVIVVKGTKTEEIRSTTQRDGDKIDIVKTPFELIITPEKLDICADFKTEVRKRGIFSVPLFYGTLSLSGNFDTAAAFASLLPSESLDTLREGTLDVMRAELVIALSGQKGIRKISTALFDGTELFFQPGNRGHALIQGQYMTEADIAVARASGSFERGNMNSGIYAPLALAENPENRNENPKTEKRTFDITIELQGGQYVRFLPLAKDTHAVITADWASPSFQGAFLPGSSNISGKDFSAEWDISYLSRDIPLFWKEYSAPLSFSASLFGVDFFRSIDTYALNTRAVKYAILFLLVPFLTLFLLEIFTKKRIHPVPYLLSGIGNAVFYLLLLSLSEQLPFFTAYLIASVAVIVMMTLYARALLPASPPRSPHKSWYMGLTVTVSYILLYAVLNAQSYALLIGSIGAFAVTALVMFLTRKLDWYGDAAIR